MGPDVDGASSQKYLVCPRSKEVCGKDSEFKLRVPDLINSLVYGDVDISKKTLPPGYTCSYTI